MLLPQTFLIFYLALRSFYKLHLCGVFSNRVKMKPIKKLVHRSPALKKHRGAALIISMIFVLVFSALAVSLAAMSGTNVQIAENQRRANRARACAESGAEVIRSWLNQVYIPGNTPTNLWFQQVASSFQSAANEISSVTTTYDSSTITIPTVILNSTEGLSFYALMTPKPTASDPNVLQVDVTGVYGSIKRTIRVNYNFGTRAHTVFDFGVATKGPLHLAGNIELEGVNVSVESDVYIVSEIDPLALSIIGNSQIAGDVHIGNPDGTVDLQGGQASIGGETGQDAIDNHVTFGVPPTEFPVPDPGYFESYATNIVDSSTDTSADATFENITIVAGTNPTFTGHVTLNGIVFVETPNVVTFTGDTTITGIIVGDGNLEDNSGTNQINLTGSVESFPISQLPAESQFDGLHDETGTFVLAPGFHLSFGGNFTTLNGAIASNGIEFSGNAGGIINGTVVNYSDETMSLSGNSDLYFNRSGATEVPAGFVPEVVLHYDPTSYCEPVS